MRTQLIYLIACFALLLIIMKPDSCFAQADSSKSGLRSVFKSGKSDNAMFDADSSMHMWGNVVMVIDRDSFNCDSAIWLHDGGIELIGNVRIIANNKVDIVADKLKIDLTRLVE